MSEKELDEMFSYFESNPNEVDKLDPESLERFGRLKEQRQASKVTQAQTQPQMNSGATGGPAGGFTDRPQEFGRPVTDKGYRDTAYSFAAGAAMDAPTTLARALGDKEAEASARSDNAARLIGQAVSPLNKIGGAGLWSGAANQMIQAGGSSLARGESLGDAALQTGVAGLASVGVPKLLGLGNSAMRSAGEKIERMGLNPERPPSPIKNAGDLIPGALDSVPRELVDETQASVDEAFMYIMRGEDPQLVENIIKSDPNYVREVVKQYNAGRPGLFSIDPSAQYARSSKTSNAALASQNAAEAPLTFERPPISSVEEPLQSRVDQLTRDGRVGEIGILLEKLKAVRAARTAQDLGRTAASLRGNNPMQSMPEAPAYSTPKAPDVGPQVKTTGNVGGQQVDSAWINESAPNPQVESPAYNLDPVGVARENQYTPMPGGGSAVKNVPIGNRMKANVGSGQDVAPSSLFEEPVQKSMSGVPVAPDELPPAYGLESKGQSLPVSDPLTVSRGRAAIAAQDANTSYPASELPGEIRRTIIDGRDVSRKMNPSEKGVLPAGHYQAVQGLEDSLRNVTSKDTADGIMNSMRVGKAADEAKAAASRNLQGSRVDPSGQALGPVGGVVHSFSNAVSGRWSNLMQNRTIDKAVQKIKFSNDPNLQEVAKWIESAGSPAAQTARAFVAAKKNKDFLKTIQDEGQGKKDDQ